MAGVFSGFKTQSNRWNPLWGGKKSKYADKLMESQRNKKNYTRGFPFTKQSSVFLITEGLFTD